MQRRALLLGVAGLAGLGSTARARSAAGAGSAAPLPVVASFSILGDLVRQVGGARVRVADLVGPDSDAHAVQPTPRMARSAAEAALLFSIGLGFEGWMQRLLDASGFHGRQVVVSAGLAPRRLPGHEGQGGQGGQGGPGDHGDHGDHGHEADPHIWHDVRHALHMVARIADGLCAADAAHAAGYRARASAYAQRLQTLDGEIRSAWSGVPAARRVAVTTHDSMAYYASAYGLRLLAAQGLSANAEPTPRALAALVRQLRSSGARALFLERGADGRLMQRLAQETGAVIGGRLYTDALSAADGPAASYEALMRHNTGSLLRALAAP